MLDSPLSLASIRSDLTQSWIFDIPISQPRYHKMTIAEQGMLLHDKSPSDGDVTLVGTGGIGVKFHTYQLQAHR